MDGTNVFQEGSLLKLSLVFVDLGEDGLPRLDVDGDISFHVSQIGKQALSFELHVPLGLDLFE